MVKSTFWPREIGQLGFLEIGIDIGAVIGTSAISRWPGSTSTRFDRSIGHDAVERRPDVGEGKIALGLGELGVEFVKRRGSFAHLCIENVALSLRGRKIGFGRRDRCRRPVAVGARLIESLGAREIFFDEGSLALEDGLRIHHIGVSHRNLGVGRENVGHPCAFACSLMRAMVAF